MIRTARIAIAVAMLFAVSQWAFEPAVSAAPRKSSRKARPAKPASLSLAPAVVNDPASSRPVARGSSGGSVLRAQVLLDRARFSPGEIDGAFGSNVEKAVAGFQKARGLEPTGSVDDATWKALNADAEPILVPYAITADDVAGPFQEIPEEMMEKATLPALSYSSPLEAIAEKFHASPKLLTRLNAGKTFDKAGEQVIVPKVGSPLPEKKAAKIVVDKSDLTVAAFDAQDKPISQYPATAGSEHDPLPVGNWKVNGVSKNPSFHYNPDLFWDAEAADEKRTIKPGPNNPVGVVWIDLSKPHYGIHGTPEPSTIGKTQSHGCIRLTNWDAWELAAMVGPGTPAILQE